MANFAMIDKDGIVVDVVTMPDVFEIDGESILKAIDGKDYKRTSYNTSKNRRKDGSTTKAAYRGNYAGIGYKYHADIDAFVPPKPFASWMLDKVECVYKAPVERPEDNNVYDWDEKNRKWVLSSPGMTRNDFKHGTFLRPLSKQ